MQLWQIRNDGDEQSVIAGVRSETAVLQNRCKVCVGVAIACYSFTRVICQNHSYNRAMFEQRFATSAQRMCVCA